jgi:hypothetical protein
VDRNQRADEAASPFAIVGATAVLLLALGGLAVAWAEDFVGCLNDEVCEGRALMRGQLVLAIANVAMALALLVLVVRRRRRASIAAAFVFAASFATWALLNDASTHGWDDLWLVPG